MEEKQNDTGLIFIGLVVLIFGTLIGFFSRNTVGNEYIMLVSGIICIIGGAIYMKAKRRSGMWGLFGLLPLIGLIILILIPAKKNSPSEKKVESNKV